MVKKGVDLLHDEPCQHCGCVAYDERPDEKPVRKFLRRLAWAVQALNDVPGNDQCEAVVHGVVDPDGRGFTPTDIELRTVVAK